MALDDDALSRAILRAGLGMIGTQNGWAGLARGGMFGVQGYDQGVEMKRRAQDDALAQQAKQYQIAQAAEALRRQQLMASIVSGSGATAAAPAPARGPSMVDDPSYRQNPIAAAMSSAAPATQAQPNGGIAQRLLNAGLIDEADKYAKTQNAVTGEVYGEPQVDKNGKVYVLTKAGPRYIDGGFVPRDKLVNVEQGGQVGFRTEYSPNIVGSAAKTMSPAERDASARGWLTTNLERDKFNRGELHDFPIDGGGTGLGFVTPGGVSMVPGSGVKQPEQPAAIRTALAQNNVTLANIDRALGLVDQNPGAFGAKNYMPDAVRQRTNPEGVDARALVMDIASQKIHDRSGASVTVNELPRLQPFVPNLTDPADTIKKKLVNFQREYSQMQQELSGGKSLADVAAPREDARTSAGRAFSKVPSLAEIQAEMLRRGQRVQ